MTPKNLDALRSSLTERLPDFAKPGLAQFEAMVREDATRRLRADFEALQKIEKIGRDAYKKLFAELDAARRRVDYVEAQSLHFYCDCEMITEAALAYIEESHPRGDAGEVALAMLADAIDKRYVLVG